MSQMSNEEYANYIKGKVGKKVVVKDKGTGYIVGVSAKYNSSWNILIDNTIHEVHDQYIKNL